MATCSDCIHSNLCSFYEDTCGVRWSDNQPECAMENIEKHCTQFKDKYRFIELPCGVGDTVYRICPVNEGDKCCNCSWEFCDCYDIGFECGSQHNSIRVISASDPKWIMRRAPYFGEIYFLTREEAEQVLEEYESE